MFLQPLSLSKYVRHGDCYLLSEAEWFMYEINNFPVPIGFFFLKITFKQHYVFVGACLQIKGIIEIQPDRNQECDSSVR